jgi:carboxyl-terminal processing protease
MHSKPRRAVVLGALALLVTISLCLAAALPGNREGYRYLFVFQEVWNLTRANYVEPVDEDKLLEGAYRGMVASLDAASAYVPPGADTELLAPKGEGRTGFELLPSGGVAVVVRVDPDTPASRAGMRPGDQVWRVDGASARQLSWPELRRLTTGDPGTELSLSILDGRNFRLRQVDLELASPPDPGYSVSVDDAAVVLRVREIDRLRDPAALVNAVEAAYERAGELPLLVDLRGVVGLDLEVAGGVAAAFGLEGPVWRLETRDGPQQTLSLEAEEPSIEAPRVFVLIDGATAGSGEALALALAEGAEGTLCGRESYGLGSLPELIPLSGGGHVLLTTRQIVSAAGQRWAGEGLEPLQSFRIGYVPSNERGQDLLLEKALEWIDEGAPLEDEDEEIRPAASLGPGASSPLRDSPFSEAA